MHYVGVQAGETTVRLVGHCNPLRLSLSAFLYLYSKCQCINGFHGGIATERRRARDGRSSGETELARQGVCVPWESHVSSMVKARGFTGRNRCLLSAPVGLLCNNRPVTLRKCREAACVFVSVFVGLFFNTRVHVCISYRAGSFCFINYLGTVMSVRIKLVRREPLVANTRN